MYFARKVSHVSARQSQLSCTAAIPAAQLRGRRVCVLKRSQELSPNGNISKKIKKILSSKIWQRRHRTVEQTRMGNIRLPKVQQMVSSVYRLLVKEDRMLHGGKRGPVSKKLERDAAVKFKVIVNFLSLNIWHVLHGIKYFYLGFIYILHRIQTFCYWVCISFNWGIDSLVCMW